MKQNFYFTGGTFFDALARDKIVFLPAPIIFPACLVIIFNLTLLVPRLLLKIACAFFAPPNTFFAEDFSQVKLFSHALVKLTQLYRIIFH